MAGQFTDSVWIGAGRPVTIIPKNLSDILDATYKEGTDYEVQGREDNDECQEIVRLGKLYAKRRDLSFRYLFTADGKLRFCMRTKRAYTKRDLKYWENL
jgi:hypothetical protein